MIAKIILLFSETILGRILQTRIDISLHNRVAMLVILPITIFLWLIGWTLFWMGSKNISQETKGSTGTELRTAVELFEEMEESIDRNGKLYNGCWAYRLRCVVDEG